MDNILRWLNENKEWIFSGIGITAITLILAEVKRLFRKKDKKQTIINQVNYGTQSTQIGIQNNQYTTEESDER